MTVKMALLANLLSALSCFIGLVIGILVGQQADARFWIFAIAAGIFLYVALVDMVSNLLNHCSPKYDNNNIQGQIYAISAVYSIIECLSSDIFKSVSL